MRILKEDMSVKNLLLYTLSLTLYSNVSFSQKIIKQIGGRYYDCLGYKSSPPNMEIFDIQWDSTDLSNPNIGDHLAPSKRIWNTLIKYYYCDCDASDRGNPPKLSRINYYKNGKKHGTWNFFDKNGQIILIESYKNDTILKSFSDK